MRLARAFASLLLGCAAAHANADTLFSDTFEADVALLNQTTFVGGWTVANGSVDIVNNFFGPGKIVDLDGSTGNAGEFTRLLSLSGGVTYTASFALAGSQRGSATEIVDVSFGTASDTFTLGASDPFGIRSLLFTPGASGIFGLTFANRGGDNIGSLLDNVSVTFNGTAVPAIPEPETYALMLGGLAMLGAVARRRALRRQR